MPGAEIKNTSLDILGRLRNATAAMHNDLENTALSKSLLEPAVTLQAYQQYLFAMQAVMNFTEEQVFPQLTALLLDLKLRYKAFLIENDLATLGNALPETNFRNNFPGAMIKPGNINFALGFMYVTEGSTLGGMYIFRNVCAKLGLDENKGAAFFYGYGKLTGKYWNDFLSVMISYVANNGHIADLVDGATYAFSTIRNFFESIDK